MSTCSRTPPATSPTSSTCRTGSWRCIPSSRPDRPALRRRAFRRLASNLASAHGQSTEPDFHDQCGRFTNAACTTTTDQSGTDSALINSDSGSTDINLPNNAGNTFVRLTAPASPTTPSTGWTFKDWSSGTGSDNPITTTTASSICVRNPGGSQNDIYVATYRQAEVGTTTTASSSAATYGATSVTLNATVTPASGSPVGTGTVTFTVRKGPPRSAVL